MRPRWLSLWGDVNILFAAYLLNWPCCHPVKSSEHLNLVLFYLNLWGLNSEGLLLLIWEQFALIFITGLSACVRLLSAPLEPLFAWLQTSEPKNKKYTQDKQAKKRTEGQGDWYKRPAVMRFPMLCKVCKKLSNLYHTVPSLSIRLINEICKIIKLAHMCSR